MKIITRTILFLSIVSLFTDVASEMLYPVMPMFLTSIGFSVLVIGLLEGIAEATAGLSKGYFGYLSDSIGKRKPFIQIGYSISAISKPMMAFLTFPLWIFGARTLDRLGKGIRTGARDAMLSSETMSEFRGRVFGFHRAFDTVGAVLGPAAALLFLMFYPLQYKLLFFLAFIPGAFAVLVTFFIKEKNKRPEQFIELRKRGWFLSFFLYWNKASREYKTIIIGLLFFALINSSDVLLLLMMRNQGATDQQVIGIYILYNLVYALASYPMGSLGDRIGLKWTFVSGIVVFAVVYGGITVVSSVAGFIFIFFLYGIYAASTEGISKAWITNVVPEREAATAIGFYTGLQSVCTLCASTLAGFLWYAFSPGIAFGASSAGAIITAIYLCFQDSSKI